MNTRTISAFLTALFLLALGSTALAQQAQQKTSKVTIATPAKLVISKIRISEGDAYEVRGKAVLTITSANSDDTVTGNLVYTLPDDARQKIASLTGKPLAQIPASVTLKDVVGRFQPATACPVVHLEFSATQADIVGVKAVFSRFVLDINESPKEQDALFCAWTKQINKGMARRGIIRRINVLINGEEEDTQNGN
ncbi:MAG TPA: hypothetical protein VNQ79_13275 [Blastocatellia bacterium]|nr:hypothetical protein [Blastocatellia bacterium]